MLCTGCGLENPQGKKFCTQCGTPFSKLCPKCGAENQPLSRFCGDCGTVQIETPATPAGDAASIQKHRTQGERRHLTVMFCDLVGSTEIAHKLDPEEWRDLVASYQRAASTAIERFDGHVAKYLGDGVMAYFGYPREPIHLHRALRASGTTGRFKAATARGLTPFVGRGDEVRMLMNRWERVREGEGQVILISGEAGIGKSRLVEQFHAQLTGTPHTWIECSSAPDFQNTPFFSVVDMIAQGFAWRADETTRGEARAT